MIFHEIHGAYFRIIGKLLEKAGAAPVSAADVPPLWEESDMIYYDRYTDGDPFADTDYRARFRTLLAAMREKKKVRISYRRRKDGVQKEYTGTLLSLEYSTKDDVFRFRFHVAVSPMTILAAGVLSTAVTDEPTETIKDVPEMRTVTVEIKDNRNSLGRAMLSFSNLQKKTENLGNDRYLVTLHYETEDKTEILIRLLSFGPFLRVLSPEGMREKWKYRIQRQVELFGGDMGDELHEAHKN